MKLGIHSSAFGKNKPLAQNWQLIKSLDFDFVEIKHYYHPDIKPFHYNGTLYKVVPEEFEKIHNILEGKQFQFHFPNEIDGYFCNITKGLTRDADLILDYAREMSKYNPDFAIPAHLGRYRKNDEGIVVINISEAEAMRNAKKMLDYMYERWDFKGKLALETMMEDFTYKDQALLGHDPRHLEQLIKGKEDAFGICIDVGHLQNGLNNSHGFFDFTHLPVYEIHFHGNYGDDDEHLIPTVENVNDYPRVLEYLANYQGLLNLEIKGQGNYDRVKELVKMLRMNSTKIPQVSSGPLPLQLAGSFPSSA